LQWNFLTRKTEYPYSGKGTKTFPDIRECRTLCAQGCVNSLMEEKDFHTIPKNGDFSLMHGN